jgi:hypothetical protein
MGAAPVELATRADSGRDAIAATPSPRVPLETLGAAPRVARSAAAPAALAAATLSSRAAEAVVPKAQPVATQTAKPSEPAPASEAEPSPVLDPRVSAPREALPSIASRDARLPGTRTATPVASPGKGFAGPFPVAAKPLRSDPAPSQNLDPGPSQKLDPGPSPRLDPAPRQQLVNQDGRAPLLPPGKIENQPLRLSPLPASAPAEPRLLPVELPLPASPTARNAIAMDFGPDETPAYVDRGEASLPPPAAIGWGKLRPTLLLIPEPGSAILLGASFAALGALRRSRRRV